MNFSIRQGKVRFEVFPLKLWDEISKIDVTFKFYLSLTFMHESGSEPPPLPFHWQHSYISWVVYLGSIHAKMHWRQEDFNIEDEKKKKGKIFLTPLSLIHWHLLWLTSLSNPRSHFLYISCQLLLSQWVLCLINHSED